MVVSTNLSYLSSQRGQKVVVGMSYFGGINLILYLKSAYQNRSKPFDSSKQRTAELPKDFKKKSAKVKSELQSRAKKVINSG